MLVAWAKKWPSTKAAAELLIEHRAWLERDDFRRQAVMIRWDPYQERFVASVNFARAAALVKDGTLPCPDADRQVMLAAAGIAGGVPARGEGSR